MKPILFLSGGVLLAAVLVLPASGEAQAREPRSESGSQSSGDSGRTAVPRGDSGTAAPAPAPRSAPEPASTPATTRDGSSRSRGGEVTTSGAERTEGVQPRARRREGSPVVGQAVPRGSVPMRDPVVRVPNYYWPGSYYPWGYGAWGLGFYHWDPFAWRPAYGYGPYGYAPHGYGYGGYGGYSTAPPSVPSRTTRHPANLRLLVEPREARDAQVFVNGHYVGIVDDFNGVFQRLRVDQGPNTIEVRKDGFETLRLDVNVRSRQTITLRGELTERAP
jgi:hypothetical protein